MSPDEKDNTGPIVAIPPPSPDVRDRVARLILERVVRRTLADLGLIPSNENLPK